MEYTKEMRILKGCLITMLAITPIWVGIDEYLHLPKHDEPILNTKTTMSGFGKITLFNVIKSDPHFNIYQDKKLGFQISTPNGSWKILSMYDALDNKNIQTLKTKGFLDGIYLNQNNNTRFMVAIFDINQKSSFDLSNYIDTQIENMKKTFDVEIPIKQVSPSNDWAIFGVNTHSKLQDSYGEQLLYLVNNRLYMLQYTGLPPSDVKVEMKSEYHSIIDSFEILK